MANFLSYDGVHCLHEGLDGCLTIDDYRKKIEGKGDSSTGLMWIDVNELFPERKVLIIDSDISKSYDWCLNNFGKYAADSLHIMKSKLDQIDGLRVNVDEIDDNLELIWNYLVGSNFDFERSLLLSKFRIEVKNIYEYNADAARKFLSSIQ